MLAALRAYLIGPLLARFDRFERHYDTQEARMSVASDALMKSLTDLSARLSSSVTDIQAKVAEAEAAQAAKDDAVFASANDAVKTMLANLGPHVEAIGQIAAAVADGAGTAKPAPIPVADVAPASTETAAQADPAPAAPATSAEAAAAAPASSSDAPASNEAAGDVAGTPAKITGDVVITTEVPSDGEPSAEDAAAIKRKR